MVVERERGTRTYIPESKRSKENFTPIVGRDGEVKWCKTEGQRKKQK